MGETNFSVEIATPKTKEVLVNKDDNYLERTRDLRRSIYQADNVIFHEKDREFDKDKFIENINNIVVNQDVFDWWLDKENIKNVRQRLDSDFNSKKEILYKELALEKKLGARFKSFFGMELKSEKLENDLDVLSEKREMVSETERDKQIEVLTSGVDYIIEHMLSTHKDSPEEVKEIYRQSLNQLTKLLVNKIGLIDKNISNDDSYKNEHLLSLIKQTWRFGGSFLSMETLGYSEDEVMEINNKCQQSFIIHFDLIKAGLMGENSYFYKDWLKSTLSNGFISWDNRSLITDKLFEIWTDISPKSAVDILKGFYFHNSTLGNELISTIIGNYGLKNNNIVEIIESWSDQLRSSDLFDRVIEDNLRAIVNLESEQTECVKTLNEEFGICNFGRYPEKVLVNQVREIDDKEINYGVVIYPFSDHNYAFHNDQRMLTGLDHDLAQGEYRMRIFESKGRIDVAKTFLKLKKRYRENKPKFLLLGGHGNHESINLGYKEGDIIRETNYNYALTLDESKKEKYYDEIAEKVYRRKHVVAEDLMGKSAEFIKDSFGPGTKVVLISCSTGTLGGIGEKLSKFLGPNVSVIAPDHDTAVPWIYADFENGQLNMTVKYSEANSMEYKGGVLKSPAGRS